MIRKRGAPCDCAHSVAQRFRSVSLFPHSRSCIAANPFQARLSSRFNCTCSVEIENYHADAGWASKHAISFEEETQFSSAAFNLLRCLLRHMHSNKRWHPGTDLRYLLIFRLVLRKIAINGTPLSFTAWQCKPFLVCMQGVPVSVDRWTAPFPCVAPCESPMRTFVTNDRFHREAPCDSLQYPCTVYKLIPLTLAQLQAAGHSWTLTDFPVLTETLKWRCSECLRERLLVESHPRKSFPFDCLAT